MEDNAWKVIEPTELKNVVKLFDEDWMALAAGKDGDCNAMTISWGEIGELWGKRIVTVFVRDSRYTKEFMDKYGCFTLSAFSENSRKALAYIGRKSGRNEDKLSAAGLHTEFTSLGNPTFKEAKLCIECRIMFKHRIGDVDNLGEEIKKWYKDGDMHTMYIGEIINVMER